tara:strand:- start:287 stop:1198 length:912 start_codon:yes stop_codon:yes gene_type:complete
MNSSKIKLKPKGHMGKTINFDSKLDHKLFMKDFLSRSYMEENFSSWCKSEKFDTSIIKLREILIDEILKKKLVNEKDFIKSDCELESMHLFLDDSQKNLDDTEQNKISINFYETSKLLKKEYVKFLNICISKLFDEKIYYQAVPTFRFHFPHQKGYKWEDRYHTDIMLGHPPYELNLWLPFTKVYGSNSMRLSSLEDSLNFMKNTDYDFELFASNVQYNKEWIRNLKKKSSSLKMNYGEYILFDPRCLHCTQYNNTDNTRISMDIRIITESNLEKYSREYRTTGRKKMLFEPGHYFSNEPINI